MQIVAHYEYPAHSGSPSAGPLRFLAVSLIALRFSIANQRTNLISAANITACLLSKVHKMRGTPHPLTQLHSQAEAS
jgi:hypothetical protein